jgi:hypothetical protein
MIKTITILIAASAAFSASSVLAAVPTSTEARAAADAVRIQAESQVTAAKEKAAAQVSAARDQVKDKLKSPVKIPKLDVPNLAQAAKTSRAVVDEKVASPRTLTYKSRASRVSRWIAPLTMGLLTYVPFDTMNADVTGAVNNLMAEEKISVESMVVDAFADQLAGGKRWSPEEPAEGVFKVEIDRYALDPVPTSVSLLRPTVSLTGRLFDNDGKLLWVGKGFTSSLEPGIKGLTLEQYQANPDVLRKDFETSVKSAAKRLAAQANAVPKASVKVAAAE